MTGTGAARARFFVWLAAVTTLSLLPLEWKEALSTKGALHDVSHVAAFWVTTLLYLEWRRPRAGAVWSVWLVAAFAFAMEGAQTAVYGNEFEWRDIGTDALGIALAVAVYVLRSRVRDVNSGWGRIE